MEELQLLLEGKLYELSREKRIAVISYLKMEKMGRMKPEGIQFKGYKWKSKAKQLMEVVKPFC